MKEMTVLEYLEKTGLLEEFAYSYGYDTIPNSIDTLMNALDDCELNYWSYCVEDADEIKDPSITVLVVDPYEKRYFELYETIVG